MKRRIRRKRKRLSTKYTLLMLTSICLFFILASLTLNISGGPLKGLAGYVFVPMQTGVNTVGEWLKDKNNDFKTLKEVLEENKELKSQVDELTLQMNTIKLEQYELDNYRELLELDEKYPSYKKVAASVIAKDSGNWFSTFTIDRGTKDGIKVGMNVLSGCGLVGIVKDVGPNYAKVRSIIDDSSRVSTMVTTTEDNFIVCGNLKAMNEKKVITFEELRDEDDEVKLGDPVVTSYVSDQYQQGILVGYISEIEKNSNNLTKSGTVTPVVDFEHLENVLVVLDLKETGKKNEKTKNTETENK